jgi:hypothetical protein
MILQPSCSTSINIDIEGSQVIEKKIEWFDTVSVARVAYIAKLTQGYRTIRECSVNKRNDGFLRSEILGCGPLHEGGILSHREQ